MQTDQSVKKVKERLEFKALLWDMDGTLVNTEPLWLLCEAELLSEFGYTWTKEDGQNCIGGPMSRVQRYMKEKSGSDLPEEWFGEELVIRMKAKLKNGAPLMPGAASLIAAAESCGIPQVIVSASEREIVDLILKQFQGTFAFAISANDVKVSKPDPMGYREAASRLGAEPGECVVIEDSRVGVTAGMLSGAFVIALPHFLDIPVAENVHVKETLEDLSIEEINEIFLQWRNKAR
jgi:HAD superfamily hydrolase (TIGR01509 family)